MSLQDIGAIAAMVLPAAMFWIRMERRFTRLEVGMGMDNGDDPLPNRVKELEMWRSHMAASCPYCHPDNEGNGGDS